jgi:galactokinase
MPPCRTGDDGSGAPGRSLTFVSDIGGMLPGAGLRVKPEPEDRPTGPLWATPDGMLWRTDGTMKRGCGGAGHVTEERFVVARAPGRVNLIGDHTDYNEGLALPMAIDLGIEVQLAEGGGDRLVLTTTFDPEPAVLDLDLAFDPDVLAAISPPWAQLAGAVLALSRPGRGGTARISSTLPAGGGLSSSAACCVALALAFGVTAPPPVMAQLCQRAEAAAGADVGVMDPLVIMAARAGHALLIDFSSMATQPVLVSPDLDVVVVHSGQVRRIGSSAYAARRAECDAVAVAIGLPVGLAGDDDVRSLSDPLLRARARHVVSECRRVRQMAPALAAGDGVTAGRLMSESHRSLSGDFAASTPAVDALVAEMVALPGVYGARMTGGGFGGCVVALCEPGAVDPSRWPGRAWRVHACDGASVGGSPA